MDVATFANIALRLHEINFNHWSSVSELGAILNDRIVPVVRESGKLHADTHAESLSRSFEQREFHSLSTHLRGLASLWKTDVIKELGSFRPKPEDDVGAIFERCRRDIAIAMMMEAAANLFDELKSFALDYELGN